jgi:K+-sensing histidine kinase KdpD
MSVSQQVEDVGAAETAAFISKAAHDLRNPIAVVRASAQMAQRQIARGDVDSAQHRLKTIVQQTDRLTEMLETFVDAARIAAGTIQLRPERLDLREVVEAATARTLALVGDQVQRSIELELPEGCTGRWDRARTIRALCALFSVALLNGDPAAPVRVEGSRSSDRVTLNVSGGGSSAATSGWGPELLTARGVVRLQGGDIRRVGRDALELELPLYIRPEGERAGNV